MAHVETLITNAQKAHDEEVAEIDRKCEQDKTDCMTKHVDSIISKFK